MQKDSIARQIYERILSMRRDQVFIAADFLDLGEYNTVRQALLRMEKSGQIQRILNGVYYCPAYSPLIGEYEAPSPSQVAEALARKFNWNIAPSGSTALNLLGLSAQVPSKWSYISDGPYHEFQVGNITLEFKHRNNREISGMSALTALIIQALKALGKGNITESQMEMIRRRLSEEDKERIQQEARQSTIWIYETIRQICA